MERIGESSCGGRQIAKGIEGVGFCKDTDCATQRSRGANIVGLEVAGDIRAQRRKGFISIEALRILRKNISSVIKPLDRIDPVIEVVVVPSEPDFSILLPNGSYLNVVVPPFVPGTTACVSRFSKSQVKLRP